MALRLDGFVDLPARVAPGDFGHAAIHEPARRLDVAHTANAGPHGLDLDAETGRLFCACADGPFLALEAATGRGQGAVTLSGPPDVIVLDPGLARCYVAVGDPGVIDVIDVRALRRLEPVPTEPGAHTIALDARRHRVYALLPRTHRAAVFADA